MAGFRWFQVVSSGFRSFLVLVSRDYRGFEIGLKVEKIYPMSPIFLISQRYRALAEISLLYTLIYKF